jgi:hypothetical protein
VLNLVCPEPIRVKSRENSQFSDYFVVLVPGSTMAEAILSINTTAARSDWASLDMIEKTTVSPFAVEAYPESE